MHVEPRNVRNAAKNDTNNSDDSDDDDVVIGGSRLNLRNDVRRLSAPQDEGD